MEQHQEPSVLRDHDALHLANGRAAVEFAWPSAKSRYSCGRGRPGYESATTM